MEKTSYLKVIKLDPKIKLDSSVNEDFDSSINTNINIEFPEPEQPELKQKKNTDSIELF